MDPIEAWYSLIPVESIRTLGAIAAVLLSLLPASAEPVRKESDPSMNTLLVVEPTSEHPRHSEGDIVQLAGGTLAMVYTRFDGGASDASSAQLVLRASTDGGSTWSADRVVVSGEGRQNVMSVSLLKNPGGDVLLLYLVKNSNRDCRAYVRRSADGMHTFSRPVRVSDRDGYNVINNARLVRLSTGRLLAPAALHLPPPGNADGWSPSADCLCYISDDDGRTWRTGREAPKPSGAKPVILQEPGVVELRDGRVMMYIRTDGGSQFQCFSSDGGETWSATEPGPLASPLSPATIARIPWSGHLLALWNDHSGAHPFTAGRRTPLCAAVSRDDGRTWLPSRVIEGDPDGWYCYTSIRFAGDRALLLYSAGDRKAGLLSRMKLAALDREFIDDLSGR